MATERSGATVVITHRVEEDRAADYEAWLGEIGPVCRSWPGHIDLQIVRPIANLTDTYTVIIRFDSVAHLTAWMESPERRALIERVRPLLKEDDRFFIRSGLDFWFVPEGAEASVPVRWKQFLVTWSAIFPLALLGAWTVAPLLRGWGPTSSLPVTTLAVTGCIVALMVYVVMPAYTRRVKGWLFR